MKLSVVLVAALALSALLLAGGARAQRTARQGNDNASGAPKSKRVVGVRSSDSGNGSRVTITADDTLKDYSAYRSGDRFYVVLPKAAAGARGGGSGRGYSDMQVQQRGDSVVLSYRVQPGAKPRVEQKFNRLDVVFDVPGDAGQQPATTNNATRQQPQQTPPVESQNPPAQQNRQTPAATTAPNANPTPERRQPTAEEAARAQAANNAAANTTAPAIVPGQQSAPVDTAAQNPSATSAEPTQEPSATASPTPEPQIAQAQQPSTIAPITTSQPAAATQTGTSLGTYLIQNWWLALVLALAVVGLGLVFAARRTTSAQPAPVESVDEDSATKLEEARAARAKEASAKALKDASAAAQASTLNAAKPSTVSTAEPVSSGDIGGTPETSGDALESVSEATPLAAATLLAGGAAVSKSRKQSRKDARQEAKRKKKGTRADEPEHAEAPDTELTLATPVVEETAVEETAAVISPVAEETAAVEPVVAETLVHEETLVETPSVEQTAVAEETAVDGMALVETPAVEEAVQEETAEVTQAVTTEEGGEVSSALEVAEPSLETAAPAFDAPGVEITELASVEAAAAVPFVLEAPAPVTEIEPAFAPDPERVLDETRHLLEGEAYDRAVIGSRDAMARQMVAAELLSALAGRNAQRRERASAAFVEHGYFDETARDLREADAPAERSAAARSLAILGDRKATPLLVAALEDPVSDVRRAAVEALGALRDPSAVEPLEALLEREKSERNRIPPRVIRTAVEFCREGFAQTPTAETQTAVPAVELRDETPTVELAPVEETAVETAPELVTDTAAPEAAEETSASVTPFFDEVAAPEPIVAPEPAAEATGEMAHVPEPVHFEDEPAAVEAETAPFVEPAAAIFGLTPAEPKELTFAELHELEAAVSEPEAVAETGVEPFVELEEELPAVETFEFSMEPRESEQTVLFDADADEATRELEPVAADSVKELAPSADNPEASEWFDFDMSEMGSGTQHAASAPTTPEPSVPEPSVPEPVFETSSGETLTGAYGAEVEEVTQESAPVFETHAEATREIESVEETAEPASLLREPEPAPFVQEPAAEVREKGLAPFDELSTVPASIQQRIASSNASERAAAIVELSHVDTDEAFQQICAAFDDEAREVRSAAARALHELRTDRAESFTRALREATPERRREIGAAISSSGLAGESISQLTGESRERTYEAFSLLFLMAKAGEVQPLLRAIEGHPNNEVRLAVVKLLALSGQKEVLPAFRRLAVRGSLPTEVRSAVMEAIYQISSSQPTPA